MGWKNTSLMANLFHKENLYKFTHAAIFSQHEINLLNEKIRFFTLQGGSQFYETG